MWYLGEHKIWVLEGVIDDLDIHNVYLLSNEELKTGDQYVLLYRSNLNRVADPNAFRVTDQHLIKVKCLWEYNKIGSSCTKIVEEPKKWIFSI